MRGEPSDEELAALIAVVMASTRDAAAEPPTSRTAWAGPAARPLRPGPGAWRSSALWRVR
ncbi:MAG: acyl-CoA carboxylase subunit epsilon [Pseudonocardiaceae bacterium]